MPVKAWPLRRVHHRRNCCRNCCQLTRIHIGDHLSLLVMMVGPAGIEPATRGLKVRCSADRPRPPTVVFAGQKRVSLREPFAHGRPPSPDQLPRLLPTGKPRRLKHPRATRTQRAGCLADRT